MKTYRVFAVLTMALLLCAPCASGQSFKDGLKQIGKRIGKQVERRVEQRVVNEATKQVDKQVDNVFDAVSGKNSDKSSDKKSDRSSDKKTERQTEQTVVTKPAARTSEKKSSTRQAAGKSARDRQLEQQYEAMLGPDVGKEEETPVTPGVKLPKVHTALFAPLGYPADASWGVKTVKPVIPPTAATKQVDWVDKQPDIYQLDNQSAVDEFLLLDQCKEDGYIEALTPADHRYYNIKGEVFARAEELNAMVRYYNELLDEYDSEDPQWVIENIETKLADLLGGDLYKRIIRSSIAPFFALKGAIDEDTKAYFAAHGGYENAVNKNLTVWDPQPDKKGVTTSIPGQTGFVVSEVSAGATVDVDGVQYVLHDRNNRWAFASEVSKTAVAGKDMVIPDYIYYNGKKFPVESMRGGLFSATTIKSVKLPNTLTEISNAAFRGTPITEITIPASVKKLQGSVFQGCTKLAKVTFEGDYMEEFSGSFQNCTSLRSVVCPRRVDMISYDMFTGCSNLTEVVLPENLKEIPSSMFDGCKKLTKIDVPHTVTKVGMSAFANCGVTELDLRNVTEFEGFCFNGCKALKKVILSSTLKDNFLTETYTEFMECPLLQVKWENNQYIIPAGFVFVP